MPANDVDPFASLRSEFGEEDEPLFPVKGVRGDSNEPNGEAAGKGAVALKAAGGPPPLPKNKTPPPPLSQRTQIVPPAASPVGPNAYAMQSAPMFAIPNIPPSFQRPPPGDPFQEPAEPRIPVGVDAEEKLKVFRGIMKGKDEALGRGRALYQAVDFEAQQLRALTTQMKGQLELAAVEVQRFADYPQQLQILKDMLEKDTIRADAAERKMENLVIRHTEVDNERRDLTHALAEVEHGLHQTSARLEAEIKARELVDEQFGETKEALKAAQTRMSEFASRMAQAKEQFELLKVQASNYAEAAKKNAQEVERLSQESARADEAQEKLHALEVEHDWAKSSLEQAQTRLLELEKQGSQVEALESQLTQAQAQTRGQVSVLQNELQQVRAQASRLQAQFEEAQATVDARTLELETRHGDLQQFQQHIERQESEMKQLYAELESAQTRETNSLAELAALKGALDAVSSQSSSSDEELADAIEKGNQRVAMLESKLKATFERAKAAETKAAQQEARAVQADARAKEAMLKVPAAVPATEIEKLKLENANLKKKLMSAETAIEAAASLRAKVSKLEAQLKTSPKK